MKIRSKALWQFISDTGALNGSEEDIAKAKAEYRKIYKRNWKRNRQIPQREMRPCFTLKEYREIWLKANEAGMNPTSFFKEQVLCILTNTISKKDREMLLQVLQCISVCSIGLEKSNIDLTELQFNISKAEELLIQYLKQ